MKPKALLYLVIIATVTVSAEGLQCYSCYGNGGDTKCAHTDEYVRARNGDGDPSFLRNCTPPFDKICYKEVYMPNGTVTSYILDCGDGKTFTFNSVTQYDYSNLTNHPNDNMTVCAGDQAHVFCLSKCDTDFCNGPQWNGGITLVISKLVVVIILFSFTRPLST